MKKVLSLIMAAVMLLSLVSCGSNNSNSTPPNSSTPEAVKPGGEVKYADAVTLAIEAGLDKLDPGEVWSAALDMYFSCVFETLVKYDGTTGKITPWLAETAEFTDENNNRIHIILRDNIYFSNGEKLTTADVEYSIARTARSTIRQYYDSCEIVDDREMYINMSNTCGEWLGALGISFSSIVCKSAAEANAEGKALIGTGPFVYDMDSYVVENRLTLNRNENYWGELPVTKQLKFVLIKDASARAVALDNGDVDYTQNLNANEVPIYQAKAGLTVVPYPSTRFVFIGFNDKRDSDSVTKEELALRRAIACAINRDEIVAALGETNASPMISMWRPDSAYIADESEFDIDLSYNPEQAKKYLAEANTAKITCVVNSNDGRSKLAAQVVQEQLRQVGITMTISESDSAGVNALSTAENPTFEMLINTNLITFLPCAGWTFFQAKSDVNKTAMNDPKILAALDIVMTTADLNKKIENLKIIQKENHDQVSYLPLFWAENSYAYRKGVENFSIEASGVAHIVGIRKVVD